MKIGVYNQFWPTAGGGEKFAAGIAGVLAADHDVSLIGHQVVDLPALGERLQIDLSGTRLAVVPHTPTAIEAASAGFELFINASYGSVDRCRAAHGIYVVHFPVMPPFAPGRARQLLISATARLDRSRDRYETLFPRGTYAPERVGPATYRWTDGDAELVLRGVEGGARVTVVLGRLAAPGTPGVGVEVVVGGRTVAATTLRPRGNALAPLAQALNFTVPSQLDLTAGELRARIHSDTWRVPGESGRVLGVPILAVVVGRLPQRVCQALYQAVAVADLDRAFLSDYRVVANSEFTAGWVRRLWGCDVELLYPPVSPQPPAGKGPLILNVGRFFPPGAGHSKRQAELVEAFRQLRSRLGEAAAGWELHLVGGCDDAGQEYLAHVRSMADGLPVFFHANASAAELRSLYGRAAVYWHATGLGEDVATHPDRFEHFGISTVEAMSAGAVPVVIGAAGQLEVVCHGRDGFHFTTIDELVAHTVRLVQDPALRARLADAARDAAVRFGPTAFATAVRGLIPGSG